MTNPITKPAFPQLFFPLSSISKESLKERRTKNKLEKLHRAFRHSKLDHDSYDDYERFLSLRTKILLGKDVSTDEIRQILRVKKDVELNEEEKEKTTEDENEEMECHGVTLEYAPCKKTTSDFVQCSACDLCFHDEYAESDNDMDDNCLCYCNICNKWLCTSCFTTWKQKIDETRGKIVFEAPLSYLVECDDEGNPRGDFAGIFPCKECENDFFEDNFETQVCSECLKKLLSKNENQENPCPAHREREKQVAKHLSPSSEDEN